MTGAESRELGELAGTLKSLSAQFATEHEETQGALIAIRGELAQIREHGSASAVAAVKELQREHDDFVNNEHKPLVKRVEHLESWRAVLLGAWLASGFILTCIAFVTKFWLDIH